MDRNLLNFKGAYGYKETRRRLMDSPALSDDKMNNTIKQTILSRIESGGNLLGERLLLNYSSIFQIPAATCT